MAMIQDKEFNFHSLRHTFGTQSSNKGVHPAVLKEVMGHSSITTTMRYVHIAEQQKREAVDKMEEWLDVPKSEDLGNIWATKQVVLIGQQKTESKMS